MKYWLIIISGLILIAFGYFENYEYLTKNFPYNGESFFKGYGHILVDNYSNGLRFIIINSLLTSLFVGGLLISFVLSIGQQQIMKTGILYFSGSIVVFLVIYGLFQLTSYNSDGYINKERIIEIYITWIFRIIGINISYWSCFLLKKITDK